MSGVVVVGSGGVTQLELRWLPLGAMPLVASTSSHLRCYSQILPSYCLTRALIEP